MLAQKLNRGEVKAYFADRKAKGFNVVMCCLVQSTLDGEPAYENTPQGLHKPEEPYWNDGDVRRYAYWSVFAGACGHTFGENSVRQVYLPRDTRPASGAKGYFMERLDTPGAKAMQPLKNLILSRPCFDRVNDQAAAAGDEGEKYDRVLVTKGEDFLMAYTYTGRDFTLQLGRTSGEEVAASGAAAFANARTGLSRTWTGAPLNCRGSLECRLFAL